MLAKMPPRCLPHTERRQAYISRRLAFIMPAHMLAIFAYGFDAARHFTPRAARSPLAASQADDFFAYSQRDDARRRHFA